MLIYIGSHAVTAEIEVDIRLHLALEPGVWIVREDDDREYAVTSLCGALEPDGAVRFAYPKGVARRPSGAWAAREQLLHRALPRTPLDEAWDALPVAVRDVLGDSYLLAREDIPATIGAPTWTTR